MTMDLFLAITCAVSAALCFLAGWTSIDSSLLYVWYTAGVIQTLTAMVYLYAHYKNNS